ncbi:MAG: LysR substrate-binding domain-containing protein, partial [Eggerthellales bacterium]|nr:LysR substrate-binding domain-containing protein [Eggerthellales bacterium]
ERHKGGVRLTTDGAKILPYAKSLCEEYDKLLQAVDEVRGLQSGLIRIATFSSGASQWLPNIIKDFQAAYPNIAYEILLGDYTEIERWIVEGRVDCGFIPLPVHESLETVLLERDQMMAVLPVDHPLAGERAFPLEELEDEPFMILEKGAGAEVDAILRGRGVKPRVNFTTWDDYAIMAMVEKGLGISILTEMIMRRCPYNVVALPLDKPVYRDIALAFRGKDRSSLALQRFIEYLPHR